MKIAYLTGFYLPAVDGPAMAVHEIATRLVKEGNEVHVFTSDSDKKQRITKKEEVMDGVHIHRCFNWFTIVNFATFYPSIFWRLWKGNFDIIHSNVSGHLYHFAAALISRLKGIPHVHTTHCCWTTGFRPWYGRILVSLVYNTFLKASFKMCDKIIAITPWEISFIEKYGGKGKIEVIPNGMSSLFFERIQPNNFKKDLSIKGKMVLFFGRLNPTKGPEKLAIAAKEMLKKRKDIDFVYVGPDEGMLETVQKITFGEPQIHILGPIKDRKKVVEMYQAADVYCLPSYREGLPLTLFEAMAAGLPVVASPVNGVPHEMKEPENGFLVQYGDIEGLKKAIEKILDDEGLAKQMSKNNIEKARQYNWDIIAERTRKVYEGVIGA